MRSAAHSRRRKASGTWTRMPAPSPVSGSQPHAPRWVRFWRTVSPFSMMSCERAPFTLTTKPTPHASRSVRGSRSHRGLGSGMLRSPRVRMALAVPPRALAGLRGRRLGGMEGELHALGVRREDDHGLGPRDAVERPDLADQALERRGVRGLHLEQQRVLAGHVVALEHGGCAETHLLADADERRAAVLLQQAEDAEVYVVQLEVGVVTESHKVEGPFLGTLDGQDAVCQVIP